MTKKRFTRRDFLRLSGLTGATMALASCAPAATPEPAATSEMTKEAVTIDWWTVAGADVGNEEDQRAWVAEFQNNSEAGKWVTVNATFLPDDGFSEKMTTVLGTGSGVPDVTTFWSADWFPLATDLREYIQRDGLDINMYSKRHFDSRCRFGDEIIGLPIGVGATMYFYNKDMFDKAGLAYPEWGYTMQQFLEDAVKMSDPDNKIFGATMPTRVWRGEFFAFGARPFSDDGKTVDGYMNGPKTLAAFEFLYDLARSGAVPTVAEFEALRTEGTGPLDLFNTGRLGFGGLNNGQFQIVDAAGVNFGLVHNPQVPGEEVVTNGWTLQLGIPDASTKKDGAWEWLKWMTGKDGQRYMMMKDHGYTPNIPALWSEHPSADDERVKFFFKILETPMVWEFSGRFPYFSKATRICQDLYDKIYLGEIEKSAIKGELDALVPVAQDIIDTEREALGLS